MRKAQHPMAGQSGHCTGVGGKQRAVQSMHRRHVCTREAAKSQLCRPLQSGMRTVPYDFELPGIDSRCNCCSCIDMIVGVLDSLQRMKAGIACVYVLTAHALQLPVLLTQRQKSRVLPSDVTWNWSALTWVMVRLKKLEAATESNGAWVLYTQIWEEIHSGCKRLNVLWREIRQAIRTSGQDGLNEVIQDCLVMALYGPVLRLGSTSGPHASSSTPAAAIISTARPGAAPTAAPLLALATVPEEEEEGAGAGAIPAAMAGRFLRVKALSRGGQVFICGPKVALVMGWASSQVIGNKVSGNKVELASPPPELHIPGP